MIDVVIGGDNIAQAFTVSKLLMARLDGPVPDVKCAACGRTFADFLAAYRSRGLPDALAFYGQTWHVGHDGQARCGDCGPRPPAREWGAP